MSEEENKPLPTNRVEHGHIFHHYRGYDIRFNDNSETWSCSTLNVEHAKLAKVKEQIGKILAAARRLEGENPAISMGGEYGSDKPVTCFVMSVADDIYEPSKYASAEEKKRGPIQQVWITKESTGGRSMGEIQRSKVLITSLAADTPENWAMIQQAQAKEAEARRLSQEARNIIKSIPRLAPFDTKPVEAKEEKPEPIEEPIRKRTTRRVR